ncbi:alpha/beta fold hydrolase [Rhodopila globiformis]|uniref:Alpha/beta hydrolase n=1 Tax=Rhodopila globiformis TaxID=1071 RepID=A0A2S6MTS8_RHOGL|nr:alpha/beta hydrolase [Rhodopila globiformis]PPQ25765.1 alpha/beta hydrolase [Rhodopila globiformis]
MIAPLDAGLLPAGMRSRFIQNVNGLTMHVLEAGMDRPGQRCVLLLHGFPELAYSWRKVMPALAQAGYYVVAPDQRGYGRTSGWDPDYDGDLASFRIFNLVRDMVGLVAALGRTSVAAVVGHDFGAAVAAWCALLRPDIFRSVTLMSAPFPGPPGLDSPQPGTETIHQALAALDRPRKHYQWYYSTRLANDDMMRCRQGVHAFLRAYYHYKSADWPGNRPIRLAAWTASELARMPTYYIMDLEQDMAQTVAAEMPPAEAACTWLPDHELRVYSDEYNRTGFQGGLQWYRCRTQGIGHQELQVFHGRTIDIPLMFIAGVCDWGVYQAPGAIERMQNRAGRDVRGCHLLDGAGHWVQQEQHGRVIDLLLTFLSGQDGGGQDGGGTKA